MKAGPAAFGKPYAAEYMAYDRLAAGQGDVALEAGEAVVWERSVVVL